jgi:hypothetical protein
VTDGLDGRARARLERFADLIGELDRGALPAYAVSLEPDSRLAAALARANVELAVASRRMAVQAEIDRFNDIVRRSFYRTDVKMRVEIARGLERAVAATVLWDLLDGETRDVLAGPWADIVEAAAT